ncbi:Hypothetical protein LUCI_2524 [Lucifera butyrica]|uniref:Uncharacterized protein n=1 Tax=Lucifera butyrica TaxID=1351585 RepID=A0A498R8M8_9FIRM|nr:hypothetical protein [Lucifera butyrica]VBB07280.1 Hypothetical protein LUCI_2524 [Lucifera butyrica]
MWRRCKEFLFGILYEQNEPSLTRVIIALAFMLFILGTIVDVILIIYGIHWLDYPTFASITGGGSIAGKVGDKLVYTFTAQKYGSPAGKMPEIKGKNSAK